MNPSPLSGEQFFGVFERYNEALWPAQFILALLAIVAVVRAWQRATLAPTIVLGVLWLWTGIAYHLAYFAPINPLAYVFGFMFVLQGILFMGIADSKHPIRFAPAWNARGVLGGALILYALLVYPLLGRALGHTYPAAPAFSAPCPTALFTFGLLLWSADRLPLRVLVIPLSWAFIGTVAVLQWGMLEDAVMPLAALAALLYGGSPLGARRTSVRRDFVTGNRDWTAVLKPVTERRD